MRAEERIAFSVELFPPLVIVIAFNRSRRIFTEQERTLLNLLHPHVVRAHRQARIFTRMQQLETIEHTLSQLSCGAITLTLAGRVQLMTAQARRWLNEYFALPRRAPIPCLPAPVQWWISSYKNTSLLSSHPVLSIRRPGKTLTIQPVKEERKDHFVLWLEERRDVFSKLGVTTRTAAVFRAQEPLHTLPRQSHNHSAADFLPRER